MELDFIVYGKPEPQGSARAFVRNGKAIVTSDNKKLRPFRSELTRVALDRAGDASLPLFPDAVTVVLTFFFARPKSAKKRGFPSVKPDLDKLVRAVLDSLTGVAFRDDAQVVHVTASKLYGDVEGVRVQVGPRV